MFKTYQISKILNTFLFLFVVVLSACKDDDEKPVPVIERGTVTDIDGNEYKTVKIGNQWWMAENLKVSKYNDGAVIPFVQDPNFGWTNVQDACCNYSTSSTTGLLYNYKAVTNSSKLAPEGWHIPTDAEWKQLETHLGMSNSEADRTGWRGSNEGEKIKMEGNTGWAFFEGVWATNESGFSAEAGSCMLFDGKSGNPGIQYNGFWWTDSENSPTEAWYRHLDYKERRIFRFHGLYNYGFSVRCVKDLN